MFSERNKLVIMVECKRHAIVIVWNNITDGIVHQAEAEELVTVKNLRGFRIFIILAGVRIGSCQRCAAVDNVRANLARSCNRLERITELHVTALMTS